MIIGMGQYVHKDYAALQDKVVADGVTRPSYEQRVKENAWMRNMDSKDQAWATRDIHYNFRNDAGEEYSKYNWKNPSLWKLVKSGTVTWTSMDGSLGNGTNGYYLTGTAILTDSWQPGLVGNNMVGGNIGLCYDLLTAGGNYVCGCNRSGQDYFSSSTNKAFLGETNTSVGVSVNGGAGHWIANKVSANSDASYKDGVLYAGPTTVTDQALPPRGMAIHARINNTNPAQDFGTNKIGYLSAGARIPNPTLYHQSLQIFKS